MSNSPLAADDRSELVRRIHDALVSDGRQPPKEPRYLALADAHAVADVIIANPDVVLRALDAKQVTTILSDNLYDHNGNALYGPTYVLPRKAK